MTRSFGEDKANITLSQKVTKQNKKKKKLCKKLKIEVEVNKLEKRREKKL